MKAKTIIFILFLSYFIGFGNLWGQGENIEKRLFKDQHGTPNYRLYKSTFILNFNSNLNQNSVNLGLKTFYIYPSFFDAKLLKGLYGDDVNNSTFEANLINYDWIKNDNYNNNQYSSSYLLNLFKLSWMGLIITYGYATNDLQSDKLGKILIIPIFLTNGQYNYEIFRNDVFESSVLMTSVFINSKLDYFSNNMSWWRYKPNFGIELSNCFNKELSNVINRKRYGFTFSVGIEKSFDIVNGQIIQNEIQPNASFKLFFIPN